MTTLITADWHFNDQVRDQYRHDFQKQLRQIVREYDCDRVIVLGDLTDDKNRHSAWLTNQIVGHIVKLAELCDVVIVRGNHDAETIDEPFFAFLGKLPHVTWINAVKAVGLELFLPFTNDWQKDWANIKWEDYRQVYTHNTFDGVMVGHGQKLPGIPPSVVKIPAISGDIHIPQRLGHITYVGAPYTVDFGDSYEPRVLLRSDKLTSLRVGGKQKRLVELKSLAGLDKVKANAGDILKVRIQLSMAEHARWPEMQAEVRKWGEEHGFQVHTVVPMILERHQQRDAQRRRARSKQDDAALVTEYGKARGIAEPTVKVGLELIEEV